MRRQTVWAASLLIASVVGAVTFRFLVPQERALTESELALGGPPLPPSQSTTATLECTRGLVATLADTGRDWFLVQDHPPCTFGGIVLLPIQATAREMLDLNRRPQVVFQVGADGRVRNALVSRTSGSRTLDEKTPKRVVAQRYRRHNCGVCKVSSEVDVDFQGPVWIREPAQ